MAKKNSLSDKQKNADLQRPAAELLYADELAMLIKRDAKKPKPIGWKLSPQSIVEFIFGNEELGIHRKFYGTRSFLERSIVALATNRGLMLIGEPGTAKSLLSELLAAAISGDSTLTVQGSAGTTEDSIKYSWNYALLLAEGANEKSMVPAPVYQGMKAGKIVRFEEITRCPLEIQDTLLSILSDRVMTIPEYKEGNQLLYAKQGFNVIATANTRDRGVNDMSAALKRRFNFETVLPIQDLREELDLVQRETDKSLARAGVPVTIPEDVTEVLVTAFHELRQGQTSTGKGLEQLSTVMSTAEAVSVGFAAGLHAHFYTDGEVNADHVTQSLIGSALKDEPDDMKKLRNYYNHIVKNRKGQAWQDFYQSKKHLG